MHPAYLWGCGLLFVVYEICLSVAVGLAHDRSQAMEIGLINYLWPSLTIVLAVLCGQQAARWWLWPGVLICLWGLARVLGGEASACRSCGAMCWATRWPMAWVLPPPCSGRPIRCWRAATVRASTPWACS
jgi:drug/metabolite transporter (DMT)-like permease